MHTVHGQAQHYGWGDSTSIPELPGKAADGQPWAEWWMGPHPAAAPATNDDQPLPPRAGASPSPPNLDPRATPPPTPCYPA